MTTKHTPGPLQYAFEGGTVAFILESDGTVVAKLSVTENTTSHRALAANARLIAAAPDLLEALREIMPFTATAAIGCHGEKCREPWCHSCNGEEEAEAAAQKGCDAYAKARAAIARATGEQP